MILDSLEIRRGAIVTRINNYLTEEWGVKKKDCSPVKFKLKAVHPKLLPQNNSCDCGVFVLQYVESLFQCLKAGHLPPAMPDDWASYHQTQNKRHQLKSLITRLGAEKNHAQTTPPTSQNHTHSSPPSPELIDIPLDPLM
ncbi:Sentrin-specific protease 7 [Geodia barretti]|uniref:Sentrin-specific protease 7 n=1 Tax=Geodia barretti TaxID=519541 RepID=A0AA35TK89_GEOBA|nr:Sentrin-specific protease 7 [Geodia barretti]